MLWALKRYDRNLGAHRTATYLLNVVSGSLSSFNIWILSVWSNKARASLCYKIPSERFDHRRKCNLSMVTKKILWYHSETHH